MNGFAAALSADDVRNVAAYFSSQTLKPSVARNIQLVELGQKIYRGGISEKNVPACAGCHSPNGAGIPAQYPRLGGQWSEYVEAQLSAFRSGARQQFGHDNHRQPAVRCRNQGRGRLHCRPALITSQTAFHQITTPKRLVIKAINTSSCHWEGRRELPLFI